MHSSVNLEDFKVLEGIIPCKQAVMISVMNFFISAPAKVFCAEVLLDTLLRHA